MAFHPSSSEGDVSDGVQTVVGQFTVSAGSDNPDPASIVFNANTLVQLDALGLTAGDEEFPLTYTLANDGKTITAQANGETIFTLTLSAVASGIDVLADVTLVLEQPINHLISNDSITLPLIIDGEDLDGTALEQGQFDWIIQDGVDPVLTSTSNAAVDESDLINGSVSDTGMFNLNVGSDFVESVFFDAADQPQLFSGGVQIIYVVSADLNRLVRY